jgi:hypothetical protein
MVRFLLAVDNHGAWVSVGELLALVTSKMTRKLPLLVLLTGNPTKVCTGGEVENLNRAYGRMTCEIS